MKKLISLTWLFFISTAATFAQPGSGYGGMRYYHFMPFVFLTAVIALVAIAIILYKYIPNTASRNKSDENNDKVKIVKERFASGKMNKNDFSEVLIRIETNENSEGIEIAKLRLAKGEISIPQYDEMLDLLKDK